MADKEYHYVINAFVEFYIVWSEDSNYYIVYHNGNKKKKFIEFKDAKDYVVHQAIEILNQLKNDYIPTEEVNQLLEILDHSEIHVLNNFEIKKVIKEKR